MDFCSAECTFTSGPPAYRQRKEIPKYLHCWSNTRTGNFRNMRREITSWLHRLPATLPHVRYLRWSVWTHCWVHDEVTKVTESAVDQQRRCDTVCACEYVCMYVCRYVYRVSQEECARLRKGGPYVKVYRYNPKHLRPKLNGYGDNGQRSLKLWQLLHTYWLPNTY